MIRLSLADMQTEVRCVVGIDQMQSITQRVLFDVVIILGIAAFLNGRDPIKALRPEGLRFPLVYVLSWQHSEHTVLSLLESGVDQYLTLPLSLQRLRSKIGCELNSKL